MKLKSKEYIEFENKYIGELTELWYKTKDEELRTIILAARKYLENVYMRL